MGFPSESSRGFVIFRPTLTHRGGVGVQVDEANKTVTFSKHQNIDFKVWLADWL